MRARWNKNPVLAIVNNHLVDYPTAINTSYLYGFGSMAGLMLVIQILTGIFLAMHYTGHVDLAFASVEHIMRDVNNGWLIRYAHAKVLFFFSSLYSYWTRTLLWVLYDSRALMGLWCGYLHLNDGYSFIGYVLPWDK